MTLSTIIATVAEPQNALPAAALVVNILSSFVQVRLEHRLTKLEVTNKFLAEKVHELTLHPPNAN